MIYIIDDDEIMCDCIAHACDNHDKVLKFTNAIDAITTLSQSNLPDLIFLDVLLDGPDGFTFLNELSSYTDTAKIPVIIVTSLDLKTNDLTNYGVVGILDKSTMTPQEIKAYVQEYCTK